MSIGSNVKSRVVNWNLTVVARHLDKQTRETKAIISEAQYLKVSQPSLKTEDYPNALQMQEVILAHKAKWEEVRLRVDSTIRIATYRLLFAKLY
jgi:hypothetical protein